MSRLPSASQKRAPPLRGAALRTAVAVFGALGDATRLRLVVTLCAGGALSIAQLTAGSAMTRQAVSKHLRVLAQAGLVRDVKAGREHLWEFEPAQLAGALASLEAIAQQWDRALQRLRVAVES